jgi:hypothetical protein
MRARQGHALANRTRGLAPILAQLLIRDARDVDAQIDAIEQRP